VIAENELEALLQEVARDLDQDVRLRPPTDSPAPGLPVPLADFYAACDGGSILFAELFPQAQAIEMRNEPPFNSEWVPFGVLPHGEFFVCSVVPEDDLWFTTWDHEVAPEIDGAAFATLAKLLQDCYQTTLEARSGLGNFLVLTEVPPHALATAVFEVKALTGHGTTEARTLVSKLPLELQLQEASEAKAALARLRAVGVSGHLKLEFL
jgi:ribosomal protein L7/L12